MYGVVENRLEPIPAMVAEKAHYIQGPEYITSLDVEIHGPGSNPSGLAILLFISHLQNTTYPKDFKIYNYVQTSLFAGSKQDTITATHNNTQTAGPAFRTSM